MVSSFKSIFGSKANLVVVAVLIGAASHTFLLDKSGGLETNNSSMGLLDNKTMVHANATNRSGVPALDVGRDLKQNMGKVMSTKPMWNMKNKKNGNFNDRKKNPAHEISAGEALSPSLNWRRPENPKKQTEVPKDKEFDARPAFRDSEEDSSTEIEKDYRNDYFSVLMSKDDIPEDSPVEPTKDSRNDYFSVMISKDAILEDQPTTSPTSKISVKSRRSGMKSNNPKQFSTDSKANTKKPMKSKLPKKSSNNGSDKGAQEFGEPAPTTKMTTSSSKIAPGRPKGSSYLDEKYPKEFEKPGKGSMEKLGMIMSRRSKGYELARPTGKSSSPIFEMLDCIPLDDEPDPTRSSMTRMMMMMKKKYNKKNSDTISKSSAMTGMMRKPRERKRNEKNDDRHLRSGVASTGRQEEDYFDLKERLLSNSGIYTVESKRTRRRMRSSGKEHARMRTTDPQSSQTDTDTVTLSDHFETGVGNYTSVTVRAEKRMKRMRNRERKGKGKGSSSETDASKGTAAYSLKKGTEEGKGKGMGMRSSTRQKMSKKRGRRKSKSKKITPMPVSRFVKYVN